RVTKITNTSLPGTLISEFEVSYSIAGNIINWSKKNETGEEVEILDYDAQNRLIHSSIEGNLSYDLLGNLMNHNSSYNVINQKIQDDSYNYTYTTNGQLSSKFNKINSTLTNYFWEKSGNLKKVEIITTEG